MIPFSFKTDRYSLPFCQRIVEIMTTKFGISEEEAIGRVNREWNGRHFVGKTHLYYHENEDYWAHNIYYGRVARWWMNPPDLEPVPFP